MAHDSSLPLSVVIRVARDQVPLAGQLDRTLIEDHWQRTSSHFNTSLNGERGV